MNSLGAQGEFVAGVTRVQLSGFLDQMQQARAAIASMYGREGLFRGGRGVVSRQEGAAEAAQPAKHQKVREWDDGGEKGSQKAVKGLQNSINVTRTCLKALLAEFELEDDVRPITQLDAQFRVNLPVCLRVRLHSGPCKRSP